VNAAVTTLPTECTSFDLPFGIESATLSTEGVMDSKKIPVSDKVEGKLLDLVFAVVAFQI